MLTALTHSPSPQLNRCALTYLAPQRIDVDRAVRQHHAYCDMLFRCGAHVMTLTQNKAMPDSVFVEDTAVVLDALAVITPMGVASRQKETDAVATALAPFRQVRRVMPPAALEGGDVLHIGNHLFVGRSARTNREGIAALEHIVGPHGYRVTPVTVQGCLHLKTGCTALDDKTVLINPGWVDCLPFAGFRTIAVPSGEPFGANILQVDGKICLHAGFTQTRVMLEQMGYATEATDISEFLKAEAGMTCMSILFDK